MNGERLPSGRFQGVSLELPTYEMATLYKKKRRIGLCHNTVYESALVTVNVWPAEFSEAM